MTLADKFTSVRLFLTPLFFMLYLLHHFFPQQTDGRTLWIVIALWTVFLVTEISDFFDGYVARKRNEVSDFGKLYDPFADTLTQLGFFLCFVIDGILSPILYLVVLYREFGIIFIRNLMLKKGKTLGARLPGKIKTVSYIIAIGFALLASSIDRLFPGNDWFPLASRTASAIFLVSVLVSVYSFFDYLSVYKKK